MHFYARFGKWLRHRRQAQSIIGERNKTARYPKSIVWQYFARGKKKFSELGWKPIALK
jgi:hypothetical protein